MPKKINRALIQGILSKGEGVKSVSSEAVDWVISVAEQAAKQLAKSGRRTPSGRLMAPRMDAGLMVRHLTKAPADALEHARKRCIKETKCGEWGDPPGSDLEPVAVFAGWLEDLNP